MIKQDIKSLEFFEVELLCKKMNLPKFRAKQIFEWLHKFGVVSFSEMSNISKDLRNDLEEKYLSLIHI